MCIFYMKIKFYRVMGGWGELYIFFWDFFNFANHHTQYMYVINYCTMVTIQCKPRLLPTHPD